MQVPPVADDDTAKEHALDVLVVRLGVSLRTPRQISSSDDQLWDGPTPRRSYGSASTHRGRGIGSIACEIDALAVGHGVAAGEGAVEALRTSGPQRRM
jgi:hypothetical protein